MAPVLLLLALVLPAADLTPETLRTLPNVVNVSATSKADKPTKRIVHILDWHLIDDEALKADLKSQGITDKLRARREAHIATVQRVQAQQVELLSALVDKHGLKEVWIEGICPEDMVKFKERMQLVNDNLELLAKLRALSAKYPDNRDLVVAGLEMEAANKFLVLNIGAGGVLGKDGKLFVLPAEDEAAHDAANPVQPDGTLVIDAEKMEARQSAIVKNVLAKGDNAVLILGGAHDLSDNVPDDCEYVRVTLKAYPAK